MNKSMLFIFLMLTNMSVSFSMTNNLTMYGTLVDEPCIIAPGDEAVSLNFGNVPDKNIYAYGRTGNEVFNIRLSQCDISIGQFVSVTFEGSENKKLPGYLSVSTSSPQPGFAIGIETLEGEFVPLGKKTDNISLNKNETSLKFKAHLKGEAEAIANHTLNIGSFNAAATFKLNYE